MNGRSAYDGSWLLPRSRTSPDLLDEITASQPGHELIVGGGERLATPRRATRRRLAKGLLGWRPARRQGCSPDGQPAGVAPDRLRVAMLGATPGADQYMVARPRARVRARPLRRHHRDHDRALRRTDYLGMLAELGAGSARLPKLARVVVVDGERQAR
jgi:hypothetical protein